MHRQLVQVPIDPKVMKKLHERSDLLGFLQTGGYLALITATERWRTGPPEGCRCGSGTPGPASWYLLLVHGKMRFTNWGTGPCSTQNF